MAKTATPVAPSAISRFVPSFIKLAQKRSACSSAVMPLSATPHHVATLRRQACVEIAQGEKEAARAEPLQSGNACLNLWKMHAQSAQKITICKPAEAGVQSRAERYGVRRSRQPPRAP